MVYIFTVDYFKNEPRITTDGTEEVHHALDFGRAAVFRARLPHEPPSTQYGKKTKLS